MTQQEAFGAVCEALGWDPIYLTASARSRVGRVAKELVEVGATVEQILYVPDAWRRIWGDGIDSPTLTDTAIVSWWPALMQQWLEKERRRQRNEAALLDAILASKEEADNALPVEENRRRWRELMARGQVVKPMP